MSQGTTLYCGDVCNHTGPHRYPPSNQPSPICPHGLDLRLHPRCWLCDPAAFKGIDVARGESVSVFRWVCSPCRRGDHAECKDGLAGDPCACAILRSHA